MKGKLVAAVLAAVLLAGGAVYAVTRFMAPAHDDAIALVPADSIVYANVFLSPSTSQKRALESLIEKFDAAPTAEEATDRLIALIDEALSESGLTYEGDIEPWLGPQAAFFVADFDQLVPEAAVLVATTDEDATRSMIDKLDEREGSAPEEQTYEGVTYDYYPDDQVASGFVEGFWVLGSESGFKAVVDTAEADESLADNERFDGITSHLNDDHLGLFYADFESLLDAMDRFAGAAGIDPEGRAALDAFGFTDLGPAAAALALTRESVVLESVTSVPEDGGLRDLMETGEGLLQELPGESWAALGAADLGRRVERFFDFSAGLAPPGTVDAVEGEFRSATGLDLRDDLLSWIGDAGIFVQGTGFLDLGGGLVIEAMDGAAARVALDKLAALALREGVAVRPDELAGAAGYAVQERGMPEPVFAVASDDRVVLAYGRKATEEALERTMPLGEAEAFVRARRALGDGFAPSFYLDARTIVRLAENMGAKRDDAYRTQIAPWVEPLTHVIAGSKLDGDVVLQRFLIGVE